MTARARLLEAVAAVIANAHPPAPSQKSLITSQLAPSVNAVASKTQDAAGDTAA